MSDSSVGGAQQLDLVVNQGQKLYVEMQFQDADEQPVDITDYVIEARFRVNVPDSPTSPITVTKLDASRGIISLSLSAAATALLSPDSPSATPARVWLLQSADAVGLDPVRLVQGYLRVSENV